jgi:outer membrane protein assembly factor BamB
VNKVSVFLFVFFLITNCSLDNKTGFWTQDEKTELKKIEIREGDLKELFVEEGAYIKEFNPGLKIAIKFKPKNNYTNTTDNNDSFINYNGSLKKISKYKFKKIEKFNYYELDLIFDKNNIIFFDNKGTIFKFNENSKLLWKKNIYNKRQKKNRPILFFSNDKNKLIIADNLAKYYALDINTGDLLWDKKHTSSFNSQIKIYKDKFFVIDLQNVLRCYSLIDGVELWNLPTDKTFIKSQKRLSLVIADEKVFFNNSIGDISSVDIETGNLLWQIPTQSDAIYEDVFRLKTSDLVAAPNSILFSNNQNEFFSINMQSGTLDWKTKINSNIKSTLIENLIFSITMEGFLVITDYKTGNVIRITDIFSGFIRDYLLDFKEAVRTNMLPVGFVVGTKNIYLTTNHGLLVVVDILTGKAQSILKLAKYSGRGKLSRPFALNKNLFIIKNNAIIKLN